MEKLLFMEKTNEEENISQKLRINGFQSIYNRQTIKNYFIRSKKNMLINGIGNKIFGYIKCSSSNS